MLKFFQKKNIEEEKPNILSKTASLLIHAAKMDENYTDKEKLIIKKTIIELGAHSKNIDQLLNNAEKNEENSNQILDFTKDIKKTEDSFKLKLIESLWKIIYSDNKSDMFEDNLMRRLSGLLYLDKKLVGNIKEKIIKDLNK
jgi:uncharacterized tellurite resistance protein B-like protein